MSIFEDTVRRHRRKHLLHVKEGLKYLHKELQDLAVLLHPYLKIRAKTRCSVNERTTQAIESGERLKMDRSVLVRASVEQLKRLRRFSDGKGMAVIARENVLRVNLSLF